MARNIFGEASAEEKEALQKYLSEDPAIQQQYSMLLQTLQKKKQPVMQNSQLDENVETTLYRGLVNVSKSDDNSFQPILLYPNQKLILPRATHSKAETAKVAAASEKNSIIIKQIDSTKAEPLRIETAWIYNRLEFRGDDFATLAAKLERWYNVKINFADTQVQKLNFNGSFEKETVEQALKALKTANSFNYKMNNNEILISSSK